MYVLGVNSYFHDASVVLIRDGEVVAAVEEERFYRDDKHTTKFPSRSIKYVLEAAGDPGLTIRHVGVNMAPMRCFSDAPSAGALLRSPLSYSRRNQKNFKHIRRATEEVRRQTRRLLRGLGYPHEFTFHEVPHHDAHAASSFFVSPFERAAVLTIDGNGEWATTTTSRGEGNKLERLGTIGLPHTLGGLYACMTEFLGFKRNNDEFKVMGLSSYGDPARYREAMAQLVRPTDDGGFQIDTSYFDVKPYSFTAGPRFPQLFGGPGRVPESELGQRDKDLAASLQERTEEIGLHLARSLQKETGLTDLCLSGGVALNCVMNTRILEETDFERIYVQPASYDAGGALGACFYIRHQVLGEPRDFVMDRANFGPEFTDATIESILSEGLLRYRKSEDIALDTARLLAEGKIVGWFQGRAEFGPRALGHRSILADPTRLDMQDHVNLRVKHREDFRPFAPSATFEDYQTYFDSPADDPFMTKVIRVRPEWRERLPAITHVDGTARLQTVKQEVNPLYHRMIREFAKLRELPIVLNTSFNVRGEPMVLTPKDALRCFFTTGIDHLAIGSYIVDK
jgi:carbamoyltransferase